MRVILADLGHNQLTVSSDVYPLGVANLAMYAREYSRYRSQLDIRIVREPQELKALLDDGGADVLGLSSYSWNHHLALHFAAYAKRRDPKTITLMGGPNFPLVPEVQEKFLRSMPNVDFAVRGPTYEGERAFLQMIDRIGDTGGSIEGVQESPLAGNMWIDKRNGDFVVGAELERIVDLDEIPSPYTSGLMDPFFSTGYLPMMQIARGCPFTCSFCNSAVKSNSKVWAHSLENLKADLLYIAERVKSEVALTFADDNFGMYNLDDEVADYIAHLQDRFGWPKYIRTTTGKNRGERIIEVMRKIRGALPMTAAVQSMNPVVLKNIERSNIKIDTYTQIQKEVRAQGMQSYGEMILCLPGETKESFLKGIKDLMDAGVKRVSAHQLMLLHGAPLSNPDSREKFGMKTRFRVVARNIGDYTGSPVIETEEMVVSSGTMSFEDYLEVRVFHLLLTIFYYEGNFEEPFELLAEAGVNQFDLVVRMQQLLDRAPAGFRAVIDRFVEESKDELFDSPEEVVAWAEKHFDQLVTGELGGNLLSKYSMIGRFIATREALDFLETVCAERLEATGRAGYQPVLRDVMSYLRSVALHCPFAESLASAPVWETSYDVAAWSAGNYSKKITDYRFDTPRTFRTLIPAEKRSLLENRLATFGEHPSGLGKFTRTLFARDLRRVLESAGAGENMGELLHERSGI